MNRKTAVELGIKADPDEDEIAIDGRVITSPAQTRQVYVLLHKPKGFISSVSDPVGRPVVIELVKIKERVFPVGRLDYDAEGVLLLTNDGELMNKLIHPGFKVEKKYLVKVKGVPDEATIEKLRVGVRLDDGKTLPAKAHFVRKSNENSWIELTVTEGRNRLVKRMCMAVGHPVQKLKRVEFAGLTCGELDSGAWRFLTGEEVERLKRLSRRTVSAPMKKQSRFAKDSQ